MILSWTLTSSSSGQGWQGCGARDDSPSLGHEVVVLESSDGVGGRIRTDVVDGFRCDRGFQVLNPAYPAVRRWVDVSTLDLKPFGSGVLVRRTNGLQVLADPMREPRLLAQTMRSGYLHPREPGRRHAVDRSRHCRPEDRSGTEGLDPRRLTRRGRCHGSPPP